MDTKKCFKCGLVKPVSEFYIHPRMKDGHLNKCISCTKIDVKNRYNILSKDNEWMDKERERGREKFKRLGYAGKFKSIRSICPYEASISAKLRRRGYDTKGKEAHHWNYNMPNSIFLISKKSHRKIHKSITVNYDDKYCYTSDGKKIETVDEAIEIFSSILKKHGIEEKLELITI